MIVAAADYQELDGDDVDQNGKSVAEDGSKTASSYNGSALESSSRSSSSSSIDCRVEAAAAASPSTSMWMDVNPPTPGVPRADWTKRVHTLWHFGRGAARADPRFRAFRCAIACNRISELYRGCAFSTAVQGRLLLARALGFLRLPAKEAAAPLHPSYAVGAGHAVPAGSPSAASNIDGSYDRRASLDVHRSRCRIHSSETAAGIKEKISKLAAANIVDEHTAAAMRTLRSFGLRAGRDNDIDPSEKPALAAAAFAVLKAVSETAQRKYPRLWHDAEADAIVESAGDYS